MKKIWLIVAILMLNAMYTLSARAENFLQGVESSAERGHFAILYKFSNPVNAQSVTYEVQDGAIQIMIPEGRMASEKNLIPVKSNGFKSVYSVLEPQGQIRSRIVFETKQKPEAYKESVRVLSDGTTLKVLIKNPKDEWSTAALGLDALKPPALDTEEDNVEPPLAAAAAPTSATPAAIAPAATPISDESANVTVPDFKTIEASNAPSAMAIAVAAAAPSATPAATATLPATIKTGSAIKESEIPVFKDATTKKAASVNPWQRLIYSFLIIVALAVGSVYFSKWYKRHTNKSTDNNKIRVLTQHHLGPRKTLAIVRVAGETILIGITDHNISLLKSFSLIDDEFSDATQTTNFNESLQKADSQHEAKLEAKIESKNYSKTATKKVASQAANSAAGTSHVGAADDLDEFVFSNIKDKISTKLKNMRPI